MAIHRTALVEEGADIHPSCEIGPFAVIGPGVKMKFVLVPPGKFLRGSPKDEKDYIRKTYGKEAGDWADREVQHEVTLSAPFYLGVYEVTQAQYEAVTDENPSRFKGADNPVEQVSWEEARGYAEALAKKLKDKQAYRLPSEAEWEYACRGGRPSSQPFGVGDGRSLSSTEANFDGNHPYGGAAKGPFLRETCRVGSYKANALGLYDMHGNVWEWCADWYGDYPSGKVTDPTGPKEGTHRVNRGGGSTCTWCRASIGGKRPRMASFSRSRSAQSIWSWVGVSTR